MKRLNFDLQVYGARGTVINTTTNVLNLCLEVSVEQCPMVVATLSVDTPTGSSYPIGRIYIFERMALRNIHLSVHPDTFWKEVFEVMGFTHVGPYSYYAHTMNHLINKIWDTLDEYKNEKLLKEAVNSLLEEAKAVAL